MARTVLVADTDTTTLELVSAVLTRHGFAVETTSEAETALWRCGNCPPDLLLLDFELQGEYLCVRFRDQPSRPRVVLLCGAGAGETERRTLMELYGCDGVLVRPFRFAPLEELLVAWDWLEPAAHGPASNIVAFSVPAPSPLDLKLLVEPMVEQAVAPEPAGAPVVATPIPIPIPVPAPAAAAAPPLAPAEALLEELDLDAIAMAAPDAEGTAADEVELELDQVVAPEPAAAPSVEAAAPAAPQGPSAAATWEIDLDLDEIGSVEPGPAAGPPASQDAAAPAAVPVPTVASRPAAAPSASPRPRTAGASTLPPGVPRYGDLTSTPLPRLVFELYLATYSGIVRLARKGLRRAIYFWGGLPVRVDSEQLDESLGMILKESGRITLEQYEAAQDLVLRSGPLMGEALVEIGALRESELLDALREQTEVKLVNAFAWRDGTYSIEDDTSFVDGAVLSEVHPVKAIWRGVREHYELVPLLEFFSRLRARYVVGTNQLAVHYETVGPFLRDLELAPLLDGRTTFEAALRSNDSRSAEIAQALYVLLVTDMIRASAGPGEPASFLARKDAGPPKAGLADYRQIMDASERIAREYLRIKAADFFAALGVERDAGAEPLEAAYQDAIERLRSDGQLPGLPHEAVRRFREILELLAQARRVLLDPDQRARYAASLGRAGRPAGDGDLAPDGHAAQEDQVRRRQALITAEQDYREGVRLLEAGDPAARERLEQAVESNPSEPAYRVALSEAISAQKGGDPAALQAAALEEIEEALRLDPGNFMANIAAAKLLVASANTGRARACVERVLQRAPHHQVARRLLAEIEAAAASVPPR